MFQQKRTGRPSEKADKENARMDLEIQTGHVFVNLFTTLALTKNQAQARDLRAEMEALLKGSWYLPGVLESYGVLTAEGLDLNSPFLGRALTDLANRSRKDRNRISKLVQRRRMQEQPSSGVSYGLNQVAVCA